MKSCSSIKNKVGGLVLHTLSKCRGIMNIRKTGSIHSNGVKIKVFNFG